MKSVLTAADVLLVLGPSAFLALFIAALAMALRMKAAAAFRAGLILGAGMTGLSLALGLFPIWEPLEVAQYYGVMPRIADGGWALLLELAVNFQAAAAVVLFAMSINALMLVLKMTRTLCVSLGYYWQILFCAALVFHTSGQSWFWMLLAVAVCSAASLLLADLMAPFMQRFLGIPGLSIPHLAVTGWWALAYGLSRGLDRIRPLEPLEEKFNLVTKKLPLLGEPAVVGLLAGLFLGLWAGAPAIEIFASGMATSAAFVILPRMADLVKLGLWDFSEGVRGYLEKRFPQRQLYIGTDAVILAAKTSVLSTAVLMVPLTFFVAPKLICPTFIAVGDVAVYFTVFAGAVCAARGKVLRALVIAFPMMVLSLLLTVDFQTVLTQMMKETGVNPVFGTELMSSFSAGSMPLVWLLWKPLQLLFR